MPSPDSTAPAASRRFNITEWTGPAWVTPAYDPAGNMTTIPKPADPTSESILQERYAYTAYDVSLFFTRGFVEQSGSSFGWC